MASVGSIRSYRFGTKNHWRRRAHNEYRRRAPDRYKRDLVVYLAGPQDLDREIAVQKGVPSAHLIGIDWCQANADRVRARGHECICGDARTVLGAWPESRKCCAVLLDYCAGLTCDAYLTVEALLFHPAFAGATCIVNMQRGREMPDPLIAGVRRDCGELLGQARGYVDPKHRGALLWCALVCRLATCYGSTDDADLIGARLRYFGEVTAPMLMGYRSGVQMDSVAFTIPASLTDDGARARINAQARRDEIGALQARLGRL